MRYFIILIILMFSFPVKAEQWTNEQKYLEAAFMAVTYIDYRQTLVIAEQGQELNPYLGANPSPQDVRRYMLAGAGLHLLISYTLPRKWRTRFQYVTVGFTTAFVVHNHWIGYRMKF